MKREDGYYWCNHYDKWDIFRFDGFEWWYAGWDGPFEESEFKEIDERRVVRNVGYTASEYLSHNTFIRAHVDVQVLEGKSKCAGKCRCGGNKLPTEDGLVCDVCG